MNQYHMNSIHVAYTNNVYIYVYIYIVFDNTKNVFLVFICGKNYFCVSEQVFASTYLIILYDIAHLIN